MPPFSRWVLTGAVDRIQAPPGTGTPAWDIRWPGLCLVVTEAEALDPIAASARTGGFCARLTVDRRTGASRFELACAGVGIEESDESRRSPDGNVTAFDETFALLTDDAWARVHREIVSRPPDVWVGAIASPPSPPRARTLALAAVPDAPSDPVAGRVADGILATRSAGALPPAVDAVVIEIAPDGRFHWAWRDATGASSEGDDRGATAFLTTLHDVGIRVGVLLGAVVWPVEEGDP